jgi:PAS domain S-box-containing protein
MTDPSRTNQELLDENALLKQRIQELEQSESGRRQAEEALQKSEARYRQIAEGLSDYLYTVRIRDGQVVETKHSLACAVVTGYTEEDFEAAPYLWLDMVVTEDRDRILEHIQGILTGKDIQPFEHRIVRKDGQIRWVSDTPILHPDSQGRLESYDGVIRDITEHKQAEEEKRILEERLQHADKMESIGTLAGGIAHDFNNLLMGIQGHASLTLLDLDPSHPHYERLKSIEEQVQSGADLTRQLLGFARGGRYEVKPADMNDIIKETSSMFGRTKKEITIQRKYGKDLRPVEVDRGQMEQVFVNLYVNAWQAMPGGGKIYLETEDVLLDDEQAVPYAVAPGRYVKISVTDTGTGMDEKTCERIFDPFFTTKEMGRGTGLGLATVYGIIKGHKGIIHVDSELGQGTTFTIYLPASEKEVVKAEKATGTTVKGTETILLVDDEKMVLEVSKAMLESTGYRVYATGSGQEALAVYMEKQKEIDLVILDMIMPGISGGETFDRLREINPGIKVLLSSGYSIEGEAQTIMDRGCNGFLQKPFRLANLSRKVREMLD